MIEQILFSTVFGVLVILFVTKIINLRSNILRIFLASLFSSIILPFVPYYGIPFFHEAGSIIVWTLSIKIFVCRNIYDALKIAVIVFTAFYAVQFFGLDLYFYSFFSFI